MKAALSTTFLASLLVLSACGETPAPGFEKGAIVAFITDIEKTPGVVLEVRCARNWNVGYCWYKLRFGHADRSEWIYEKELREVE